MFLQVLRRDVPGTVGCIVGRGHAPAKASQIDLMAPGTFAEMQRGHVSADEAFVDRPGCVYLHERNVRSVSSSSEFDSYQQVFVTQIAPIEKLGIDFSELFPAKCIF